MKLIYTHNFKSSVFGKLTVKVFTEDREIMLKVDDHAPDHKTTVKPKGFNQWRELCLDEVRSLHPIQQIAV